jgi:carboxyl-terminal processing protease
MEADRRIIPSRIARSPSAYMTRVSARFLLPALLLFVLGLAAGARFSGVFRSPDSLEQLRKLEDAYMLIDRKYVEDVPAERIVERAIEAMLDELDPHSSYISADLVPKVQEGYRGTFGGIGIWFESPADDTARVTSIIPDGPSEDVGLLPGDLIVAVDDSVVVGLISTGIQDLIKGEVGTDVRLTIVRRGVGDPFDLTIRRGRIPLFSIDASYMVDATTGYVRIGRFAMTTHTEFRDELTRLKERGMQRLVLDLRDNPGGIKQTAVLVADELLPAGKTIVFTRSRNESEEETDVSRSGGLFEEGAVIVLVNENTASGSEIVSGALQDHDRALIVGRRTFGKGLVQRPFELRDGSVLQLTVSKYFMPSGRLIQTPYEDGDIEKYFASKRGDLREATYSPTEYLEHIPDSLRFTTAAGRTVFGGGGVMPDIVVAPDSLAAINHPLVGAVVSRSHDALYSRRWFLERETAFRAEWTDRREAFESGFAVDDAFMDGFRAYLEENGIVISDDTSAVDGQLRFTPGAAAEVDEVLRTVLKARIAQRLFRSEAWFPIFNRIDPMVLAALGQWADAEALALNTTPRR